MRLQESIYGCGPSEYEAPWMQDLHRMEIICICTLFSLLYRTLLINGLGGEVEYAQLERPFEIKYIQDEGLSGKKITQRSESEATETTSKINLKRKRFL